MSLNLGIIASQRGTAAPLAGLLLDTYPSAAAAYSLRKLRTAYSGSAIRVRRSSDNTESDIGFNGGGGLDTTALTTFVGAGNGFVRTWYDQSGSGNNLTQATTTLQPNIVTSGVVNTRNSKPCIIFSANRLVFTNTITTAIGSSFSFWMTYEKSAATNNSVLQNTANNSYHWLDYLTTQYLNGANNNIVITSLATNSYGLINIITNYSVGATMYRNSASIGSRGALTGSSVSNYFLNNASIVRTSEFIFYASNKTSDRTGINANINLFYTIF